MIDRREFLKIAGLTATWPCAGAWAQPSGVIVNDLHSQLNPTRVNRVVEPDSLDAVRAAIAAAKREDRAVCIAGGRHAMGAQAFATDGVLVDIRKLDRVLAFDMERGLIEVESGMQWPKLLDELTSAQRGRARQWGFAQKQTGADRLTMGGCLSANVHGRGLTLPPFVGDVESFKLLDAQGDLKNCSRVENPELFRLAIGGYGLFGLIYSVTLRLVPRRKLERGSRCATSQSCPRPSPAASATAFSTAISSTRSTRVRTASFAAASSPATGRSPTRRRSPPRRRSLRSGIGPNSSTSRTLTRPAPSSVTPATT
jgi:FAD/FMN-containing dehydrogenase